MRHVPDGVRAVFFDAVGTIIHPEPAVGEAYFHAGRRHGSRLDLAEVGRRFAAAFRREELADAATGHRCDEAREDERWRRIVGEVLSDVADVGACFRELHEHFAAPSAWRVEPGAAEVLSALRRSGRAVGIASNFDRRLRGVVAGLPQLGPLDHLAISSEIGWKKPAPEFFAALGAMTGLPADQILLVGDDEDNDVRGATAAGMRALFVGRGGVPLAELARGPGAG